jgi:hypothetical protein
VDEVKKTAYCIPLDESKADIMDVRLIADNKTGLFMVPKKGSIVIVSFISNEAAYVSMFSEVDKILLNGDANGGLIKIQDLLTEVNNRNTTFKTAITAALTSIDASIAALGGASASAAAFATATAAITNILKATIENTTVKHGNG